MANLNSSSFLRIQNPNNESVKVPPQSNGMPLSNGYRPDVHHTDLYHGVNYHYGYWAQDCDIASCQGPPLAPPPAANLGESFAYYRNPNVDHDYPAPVNDQDNLVASGSSHMECPSPSAHAKPDDGVRNRAPLMPDSANSFSQSVSDPPPSGTSAMESLKHLADRYLHDPGSHIDTLRMGLSPTGGRLRVTVVFDIDV